MDLDTAPPRAFRDRRARELRLAMSLTERRLWLRLRARRVMGWKFRRQVPIGPFYVDFACLEARLVVEVDGPQHGSREAYDGLRDRWLEERGFRVLRVWVMDLDEDLDAVVERIAQALGREGPGRTVQEAPFLEAPLLTSARSGGGSLRTWVGPSLPR